jgi:hypothetical protein
MNEPDNPITHALREIAAQAGPPGLSADAAWRAGRRRRLAAMAAAAAAITAAAVLVPLAVHGVLGGTAAAPTSPAAVPGVVTTLSETTSSPAGTMTVQVRFRPERTGARLLSITYWGRSHASVRHPALVFALSKPVAPHHTALVDIAVKLTRSELRHFAGSVPLRPSVRRLPVVASTLTAFLGGPFGPMTHHEHSTMQNGKSSRFHVLIQEALLIIVRE